MDLFEFVNHVSDTAKSHNVEFILSKERSVDGCNGFFSEDPDQLVVATGQPVSRWLPILVHESAHMDQWIEQIPEWSDCYIEGCEIEMFDVVIMWTSHQVELNKQQLTKYITGSRNVELDCEKRAAAKIIELGLDIDSDEYIQKANAYIWFYTLLARTRKWYSIDKEPYNIPAIWKTMPMHFDNDYTKVPAKMKKLYLEHCY